MGMPQKRQKSILREYVDTAVYAVLLTLILRVFVVQAFRIPSESMLPTLLVGDFLFVNKALYGAEVPLVHTRLPAFREPRLGDIVVFDSRTQADVKVVKRLVGMPGDTLEMKDNALLRNGIRQVEPFTQHSDSLTDPAEPEMRTWQLEYLLPDVDRASYRPSRGNWGPIVVPAGQYFVMGDNRDNSYDSRYWGFVDRRVIRGRPLFVYYSFDHDSWRALPFLTAIRWGRIGTRPL